MFISFFTGYIPFRYNSPNVLILDEPTNGLDPEGIKELRDLLKKLAKKEKMGILISSHNLSELETFCTDVVIIKNILIFQRYWFV